MKKYVSILLLLLSAISVFAQESESLKSLKDSIYYYYDRSEFEEVLLYGKKALAVYEAEGNLYDMAGCYNVMGNAYQRLGRFRESIESYEQCDGALEKLKASENLDEKARIAYDKNIRYTRNNMAQMFVAIDELDEAEKLYIDCINMLSQPKDTIDFRDLATYKQNLSMVFMKKAEGKDGEEKEHLLNSSVMMAEQAVALSRQYGDLPFKQISKMVTLAQAYHAAGRMEDAKRIADEALAMSEAKGDPYLLAETHNVQGDIEASLGQFRVAESHYAQAIALATENHFDELKMNACKGAYTAARQFDKALALSYFEDYTELKDSVFSERQQEIIRDYQVKYDLLEKEHQLTIETEKNRSNRQIIVLLGILAVMLLVLFVLGMRMSFVRKRQNEMLARLGKTKDRLFSIVSHDFKTSVLSQNMLLSVMNERLDEMPPDLIKQKMQTLKASSDSLRDNMFNLIEWVKLELNGDRNMCRPFNLRSLVDGCIGWQKAEIGRKRLEVVNAVDADLTVNDDPDMVTLVLRNLVSNAVKFSWNNGTVRIEVQEDGNKVWLVVIDQGVGMSRERKEAVMDTPISPTKGTHGDTGSGIGLMVCRQVLEHNDGKIEIESEEGKGTTVRFTVKK